MLKIKFDPFRGGFCIAVGEFRRHTSLPIFGGLLNAFTSDTQKIIAVESMRDRGGMRFAGLTIADPRWRWPIPEFLLARPVPSKALRGNFALAPDGSQTGAEEIKITQDANHISLWGGGYTPGRWPAVHHAIGRAIMIWTSEDWVLGIRLGFSALATNYPIESVEFSPADFK